MTNFNSYSLHNYKTIPQISLLTEEQIEAIDIVGRVLPFKVNNYVIEELIDWNNIPNDPIFTLTFPRKEMLSKSAYNKLKKLINDEADKDIIKQEITNIRMKLNPNPAGQEFNVPVMGEVKLKGIQH
ncbi:MAG TPA: lysine 2,3-aminomutase, partial [Porphyromonadaceae bacterium]|nr:lysine 2,3-aminomutase [Porphyromonadaceae bacterium]